ncbi:LLM class flavin-dependent oxidoreductase [Planococcus lenghuensis]|uniref:Luciferase family oxidoreductase n=1 Tax=Planococcus lenghuensis TaxID=2213202 RepID=A0A1Q2KUJ1_9BACL|nr:LLM class flavin-dependent oxidoreductase [Planococcus lenghuensis]AQQ51878.1 luciferase family oxidoreductase [Planococcus lenghuensis]
MTSLSILDYSPIDEESTPDQALRETTQLAKLADTLGYKRFWVSEHHHIPSVAGSSPQMLMMHLAANTTKIRIGSGGILLPNYSPYKVAENIRVLQALYPGRIDLGIGSGTGANRIATKALQAGKPRTDHREQTADLIGYLSGTLPPEHPYSNLIVSPNIDAVPDIWLLGAGGTSTEMAAEFGTALTFAHFARPGIGPETAGQYRESFIPSAFCSKPRVMIAVFVVVAETNERAEELAKAFDLWLYFVESLSSPPYYPSAETASQRGTSEREREKMIRNRSRVLIGDALSVKTQLDKLINQYNADEVLIMPHIAGFENRKTAIRLLADAFHLA